MLKQHHLIFFSLIFLGILAACEPEEEQITYDAAAQLRFSRDTVLFDTIFTSRQSITKRLRVYNDQSKAVKIANIALANGTNSQYKIYVNGQAGAEFDDVTLLGGDSLLVLVEVTIDPMNTNLPFIVTDKLQFNTNGNHQDVKLVAWGQDAVFLNGEILPCNMTFTADKPYVIFNSIVIDSLCNLTVEAGAHIYSHSGSFIFVRGSLYVQGTADQRVIFRNDRFEEEYENAPGQWGGLIFLPGSKNNHIDYADIRNGQFGIYLGTPDENENYDLIVSNTRIENMGGNETFMGNIINVQPGYGVIGITSDLYMYNTLIDNCAINVVGNYAGGNYRYEHCTFANYSFDFFRDDPAVVIADNLQLADNSLLVGDLNVSIINSIIWGNLNEELVVSNSGQSNFSFEAMNNILRAPANELFDTTNHLNKDPKFIDPADYQYELDTLSPAKDAGKGIGIPTDLNGDMRDSNPDIGAFERIEN